MTAYSGAGLTACSGARLMAKRIAHSGAGTRLLLFLVQTWAEDFLTPAARCRPHGLGHGRDRRVVKNPVARGSNLINNDAPLDAIQYDFALLLGRLGEEQKSVATLNTRPSFAEMRGEETQCASVQ